MKKRATPVSNEAEGSSLAREEKRPKTGGPQEPRNNNEYKGFSLPILTKASGEITCNFKVPVEPASISPKDFFEKYVATRTPCIIDGLPPSNPTIITPDIVKEHAGSVQVQVEKRYSRDELFGQNRTPSRQFVPSISDFVDGLRSEDGDLLYLSTQQPTKENDEQTITPSPFEGPCQTLVDKGLLPKALSWAGHMILQSCNLWMGSSVKGSCSGLHHDYHDNFYLLFEGRKQFRLFSPDMAADMYTYGKIDCIHPNGLISHAGNELRADGVPLELLQKTEGVDEDEEDEEEEELVLGKGFDYESSDSEDEGVFDKAVLEEDDENVKDDYDEVVGDDEDEEKDTKNNARPDSFSQVDLLLPKEDLSKKFPDFPHSVECVVDLKADQSLYLPASWFHCVTSFAETSSKKQPTHTAINYWYHTPDKLDSYNNPYLDDFWKKQRNI